MKTKNIFKTLAFAMLMPAMLLTTACSSDDDAIANNNETPAKKGYPLQVTVNVTRQGDDATTRATYNESTRKLSFSEGDQLFVSGFHDNAGQFAGTLQYVNGSDGSFSGTLITESEYEGTLEDFFENCGGEATLLPAGYEEYDFLTISDVIDYYDNVNDNYANAFAASKKIAVEQFSYEKGDYITGTGFELKPQNAILSFTITGLTAENDVEVLFTKNENPIIKHVVTDASGNATFAFGVEKDVDLEKCSLRVDGNNFTITSSSKKVEAGHIYKISKRVPYTELKDGDVLHVGDIINPSEEICFSDLGVYIGGPSDSKSPYTVLRADMTFDDEWGDMVELNEKADGNYYVLKSNTGEYYYTEGRLLPVTDTSDGILVIFEGKPYNWNNYNFAVHEP